MLGTENGTYFSFSYESQWESNIDHVQQNKETWGFKTSWGRTRQLQILGDYDFKQHPWPNVLQNITFPKGVWRLNSKDLNCKIIKCTFEWQPKQGIILYMQLYVNELLPSSLAETFGFVMSQKVPFMLCLRWRFRLFNYCSLLLIIKCRGQQCIGLNVLPCL